MAAAASPGPDSQNTVAPAQKGTALSLDQLYQQIILDHSKERHGSGLSETPVPAGASTGSSHQLNPVCGDEVTLRLAVKEGKIAQIAWDGDGCSISMASASVLSEMAEGLNVSDLRTLIDAFRDVLRSRGKIAADPEILGDAAAFEGVSRYAARVKCAMIAWVAAEDSLNQAT